MRQFQYYFDNSVAFDLFLFRNECVWLLNLALKVVSQLPIYFMILLLLAFFFRDPEVLIALAAVCESCCGVTLFLGVNAYSEYLGVNAHCCHIANPSRGW